jgi:hypothetical protein
MRALRESIFDQRMEPAASSEQTGAYRGRLDTKQVGNGAVPKPVAYAQVQHEPVLSG